MEYSEFRTRVALVTGGASGIGRSLVRALSRAGCSVAIADVDDAAARVLESELREAGARALAIHCDVACFEEVVAVEKEVRARLGPVSLLFNNAGIGGGIGPPSVEVPERRWESVLGVNLHGVIHGIRAFVPSMIEAGAGGHVVNTASMAALLPAPGTAPYTLTKFAVAGLSEVLRGELSEHRIGVSVLCPGPFRTAIWGDDDESDQGADPAILGPRVLAGIEANESYIFTHPEFAMMVENRFQTILHQLRESGRAMQRAAKELS